MEEKSKERDKSHKASKHALAEPSSSKVKAHKSHRSKKKKYSSSETESDSEEDRRKSRRKSKRKHSTDNSGSDETSDSVTSSNEERKKSRDKKKRKKSKVNKKKKSKEKTKEIRDSSASSDSSVVDVKEKKKEKERDDWMTMQSIIPTYDRIKEVKPKKDMNTCIVAAPGQSNRELNPYWKNGGSGLPSVVKDLHVTSSSIGDKGLEWYERALTRAQETAEEEGRSLAEVVSERWGSLDKLKSLISEAKSKKREPPIRENKPRLDFRKPGEEYGRSYSDRREEKRGNWRKGRDEQSREGRERTARRSRSRSRDRDRHHERDDRRRRSRSRSKGRDRAGESKRDDRYRRRSRSKEKDSRSEKYCRERRSRSNDRSKNEKRSRSRSKDKERIKKDVNDFKEQEEFEKLKETKEPEVKVLTDDQLNALAAKLIKAEIMGKTEQIEKLKKTLEEARLVREQAAKDGKLPESRPVETVVLMHTNRQGVTIPVKKPEHLEPTRGRRKEKKVETHKGGQRQRYFADDDQRDLKEMFQQEKLSSANDDKALFLKMATRRAGAGSDEEDAAFADAARLAESSGKMQQRELNQAIKEAEHKRKTLDGCQWCLDSKHRAKHLLVSIGETCYLCLPAESSLTPLHCLLVPVQHTPCGTQLDEDVWEEMHRYRRAIISMAKDLGQDVIFFEQTRILKNHPHMVLNCVVMDKEVSDMAPIYFKKALLDSGSEWAHNKKVVDIKGPDIRRTIPKGLPYFAVEFTPQGGFAHVIEDEKMFPNNFAQSIIGGMLDLDHRQWRKPQKSSMAAQREKTVSFSRKFSKYDFNAKKKNKSSSSSNSSNSDFSDSSEQSS